MYATTHPDRRIGSANGVQMGQPQPIRAPGYGHVPPPAASPDRERPAPPEQAASPQAGRGGSTDRPPPDTPAAAREAWYHARVWAGIRTEVAHRLVGMNVRHGMHAWAARRDRPVAPWALAFLYAHPTDMTYDGVAQYAVVAATRMVDDDEELPGPAHLLYALSRIADERHRNERGWFDPRVMCTYTDPVTTPASFVGVGLSCLGTAAQPWAHLRRGDTDDIPGHCYALTADGTALLLSRAARSDLGRVVVHGTGDLSRQHDVTGRRWVPHPDVRSMPDSDLDVWDQLHHLHHLTARQQPLPTLQPAPAPGERS